MGLGKLIKDLTTWTTHTQKHWIEVQNDGENVSKKAELDWRVLRSMGVRVTTLGIDGGNRVRYTQIPLGNGVFLVTVTADIEPNQSNVSTTGTIPEGLRPKYLEEVRTYFGDGTSPPNNAISNDGRVLVAMQVYGDEGAGSGGQASGKVRLLNQHTHARTLSVTYVSNAASGGKVGIGDNGTSNGIGGEIPTLM